MKWALAASLVIALSMTAVISRRPKLVLLFAWVLSLTYNRQYFSFESLAGNNSSQGPYWIVADFFFALLLALWAAEAVVFKRIRRPESVAVSALFLPFAVVGSLSALGAERPDWSLYELIRAAKVVAIFLYVRYNFTKYEWWTGAVAMVCAAFLQSAMGILEVSTGRTGVLGVLGLGKSLAEFPEVFSQEQFYGWRRATGTMNHPPYLACYLLLTLPMPLAVALSGAHRHIRAIAGACGIVGLVGLACTLSRWPWALAVGQLLLLLVVLTALHMLSVKRALGMLSVAGFVGILALLPFTDFIADRINRDLDRSLDFRANENRVAMAMFADHPLLGVGPNNYKLYLEHYNSEMVWALGNEDIAVKTLKVRFIAAPQNGFLLPLAETGIAGFCAFLFFLGAVLVVGVRAIAASDGWHRSALIGLVIGMLGVIAQQIVDYSFWTDPVLYSFALAVAMLAEARVLES
jgi:putative inorganic carbon (HCO3(-)) transporter